MSQQTLQLIITALIVAACAVYVLRKVFFKKAPPRSSGATRTGTCGDCSACGRCGGCH